MVFWFFSVTGIFTTLGLFFDFFKQFFIDFVGFVDVDVVVIWRCWTIL
jgi:hypothetical protein